MSDDDTYGIAEITNLEETVAPDLPHEPSDPESYAPKIALIGTGGISEQHLDAYTVANYDVVALCNRTREKAIEEDREPTNSARNNLRSLELCYAAVASAEDHEPKVPSEVRELRIRE